MIEIIFLSLIQGVTEFIPVSSSSHLFLISEFVDFKQKSLTIDVSLHIGSFLAVLTYFYKDIANLIENKKLLIKIFISSLPIILVGFVLIQTNLIENFRNLKVIGWTTLIFGVLLFLSDRFDIRKTLSSDFDFKAVLIIGFFQVLSLVPGVSRSGITITAARFLKFKRLDAAKISFLISIPTLCVVSLYGLKNIIISEDLNFSIINIISLIFSFLFSLMTIKYFLKYIQKFSLDLFVVYRVALGFALLVISYL